MVMEELLFPPTKPNVSLEIRLPTSKSPQQGSEAMELGCFSMRSNNNTTSNTTTTTDLSLSPSANPIVRPIKGIPLYQYHNPHPFPSSINVHRRQQGQSRSRIVSGIPPRKSARAPRMKWTTSLHARFVHAVELLGGHERATPKSVLELMDVKDLTLAHVKSHLQMYRTVKSTDKPTASSVLMDGFENGSEREECYDYNLFQFPSSQHWERKSAKQDYGYPGLWTNSSSGVHLHGTLGDNWMEKKSTFEKEMRATKGLGRSCEEKYSPYLEHNPAVKPNLDFTLGI